MNDCEYVVINSNVIQGIEGIIGDKKFVYALAIDSEGNTKHLIQENAEFHKLSQPIFTQKFMLGSLSFYSIVECCNKVLDANAISQIDALLNNQQQFILVFDTEGEVTVFKRQNEMGVCNFAPEIKASSISYGVFEGSCCYFMVIGGVRRPVYCINVPCSQCPPGFECV